jgi:type I restriction enzyme S subunit
MGNVDYAGTLNLADLKFVNLPDSEAEKYRLRDGDILFNRTNSKELVGKTGLWGNERDAVVASYFIRLRVDRNKLHPSYLWAFMNSRHMKRVIFDTARGAIGQANINSKEIKAFPIAVPPLHLQQKYAARLEDIRAIQSQQAAATATAQATFDALLGKIFT